MRQKVDSDCDDGIVNLNIPTGIPARFARPSRALPIKAKLSILQGMCLRRKLCRLVQ
jgi:hypothetical protein